jgi:hypothetical protein
MNEPNSITIHEEINCPSCGAKYELDSDLVREPIPQTFSQSKNEPNSFFGCLGTLCIAGFVLFAWLGTTVGIANIGMAITSYLESRCDESKLIDVFHFFSIILSPIIAGIILYKIFILLQNGYRKELS